MLRLVDPAPDWTSAIVVRSEQQVSCKREYLSPSRLPSREKEHSRTLTRRNVFPETIPPRRFLAVVKPYSEQRAGLISANNNTD